MFQVTVASLSWKDATNLIWIPLIPIFIAFSVNKFNDTIQSYIMKLFFLLKMDENRKFNEFQDFEPKFILTEFWIIILIVLIIPIVVIIIVIAI